jgi:hypothetical protein
MPGKMARSAPRPPFGLPEGAGSRPHLAFFFQASGKSANIHATLGVIWGIPVELMHEMTARPDRRGLCIERQPVPQTLAEAISQHAVRDPRPARDCRDTVCSIFVS